MPRLTRTTDRVTVWDSGSSQRIAQVCEGTYIAAGEPPARNLAYFRCREMTLQALVEGGAEPVAGRGGA